ncbi:hypothetical protein SORBI_3004G324800 [Sorghum bicolor]|uniref:Uncharacterized protein n=1 Tax=Sorghum bicolor TaxID=4558 RepID=A0A1Z5RQ09_SORBI|nr:hypothetical protein SORBI_3004G324800 [Sorghum bicolor]
MTLSRRFLNLIVDSQIRGVRTLRRIDLTRQQFFNPGPPPPLHGNGSAAAAASEASESTMERIRLPRPIVTFRASAHDGRWAIQCFPLGENKVLCADQSGRTFLFDADTRHVVTMPSLHKPKDTPFSIFIPSASDDSNSDGFEDDDDDDVGTLFVMEGYPSMEPTSDDQSPNDQPSDEFEAYVYGKRKLAHFKSWKCQPLPPPPYVRDPTWMKFRPQITTYAVVGGGAQILISAESAGTYCMDTATHKWSQVGRWMLPLHGKIEYVPELDLWFGFSAKDQLSAVDLSNLDSRPRLVGTWKEFERPEDWQESQEPQFVSLGSGKFCIARCCHASMCAMGMAVPMTAKGMAVPMAAMGMGMAMAMQAAMAIQPAFATVAVAVAMATVAKGNSGWSSISRDVTYLPTVLSSSQCSELFWDLLCFEERLAHLALN